MKKLLVIAGLILSACSHQQSPPSTMPPLPPVVVPTPTPVPTPAPAVDAAFCQSAGKVLTCGTNEWWHLACGGVESQEQVYFESKDQLIAKSDELKVSSCVAIFSSSGQDVVHFGFGPCVPCQQLGGVSAKSLGASDYDKAVQAYKAYKAKKK